MFPNLRELATDSITQVEFTDSVLPDKTWRRGPLRSSELAWLQREEFEFVALCGITPRRIDLAVGDAMIEKIVVCSSDAMGRLVPQSTLLSRDPDLGGQVDASTRYTPSLDTREHVPPCRPHATASSPCQSWKSRPTRAPFLVASQIYRLASTRPQFYFPHFRIPGIDYRRGHPNFPHMD